MYCVVFVRVREKVAFMLIGTQRSRSVQQQVSLWRDSNLSMRGGLVLLTHEQHVIPGVWVQKCLRVLGLAG